MGLLDKILPGRGGDLTPLPDDSYARQRIDYVTTLLQRLAQETPRERLEVVPAEQAAYVFIGKPPKRFGLAWIHDGRISNFKTLVEEDGINPIRLERITDRLREAYAGADEATRYSFDLQGRELVVTPSDTLERDVHAIIDEVLASKR